MSQFLMSPEDACERVLTEIRSSNLHFLVQESAFSLYITIRKKFIKGSSPKVSQPLEQKKEAHSHTELLEKIQDLESQKELLEHQVKVKIDVENSDKHHVKILEEKLVKAEADMFKHSEQFKMATDKLATENKILKESLKKSSEEIKTQKKNVSE